MIVKISFEFETDLREFRKWNVEGEGYTIQHSGSSYYRILQDGKQVGTVGGHCPGSEPNCEKQNHISISLDKK